MPTASNGRVRFTLSADGTLTGTVDTSHTGPEGADLRLLIKYTDEKERREFWEKLVADDLPGVILDSFTLCNQPRSGSSRWSSITR